MNRFDQRVNKILEDFNVYPQARNVYGRPAPSPGPNINFTGPLPTGFKGAGIPGIAPGPESGVLVKWPKKKKVQRKTKAGKGS